MSIWSLTYQQSVFKHYHSDKHLSQFYLQNGGKNQEAYIWNKITSLSPYVYNTMPYMFCHIARHFEFTLFRVVASSCQLGAKV